MVWDWVLGSRILIQNTWCVIGFWDVVIFSRATHNASHLHRLEQHGSLPGCYLKPLNTSEPAFFLFFQQTTTCQFHSLVCSHLTHHLPVPLPPSARLTHHLTSSHIISHTICLFPYHLPQGSHIISHHHTSSHIITHHLTHHLPVPLPPSTRLSGFVTVCGQS